MIDDRTEEQKARSKRVHAMVMIILGAIMSVCALAAGLIALTPGVFPSWMTGGWRRTDAPHFRLPVKLLVSFSKFNASALNQARLQHKLVLLHLAPSWSREAKLMEESCYGDPAIATWIQANFVATRADVDERPDLAFQYGVGAWPTTALIDSEGRLLAGATRLTPKLLRPWADLIQKTIQEEPGKAAGFEADASRRLQAVRQRPLPLFMRDDPVWGGTFQGPGEYAKTLADQTRVILASDTVRAKSALFFIERFMTRPTGGYASSVAGELTLSDGRIEEGASYFNKNDLERRSIGLPIVDWRLFAGANADMARAVLLSKISSANQKKHARSTLEMLWTLFIRDGEVLHGVGGLKQWSEDRRALIDASIAAGDQRRVRLLRKLSIN